MTGLDVTHAGALLAGLLSFLSPCVLPLVPPYLCWLGGVSVDDALRREPHATRRVLLAALVFVLGFSTVFVALGAGASAVGRLVAEYFDMLATVAGVVIIVLGLHFLGVFRIGVLLREVRIDPGSRPVGLAGAYVVGLAFAFGWTPCVGPVLAAVLMVAAGEASLLRGAGLLAAYSAGLGLPFLGVAFAVGRFAEAMRRHRRAVVVAEKVAGGLLVVTGILFLTGSMNTIGYWLFDAFPSLGALG